MKLSHPRYLRWRSPAAISLAAALLACLAWIAWAADYDDTLTVEKGETFTLNEGETIDGELVVMGGKAYILGKVTGSVVVVDGRATLGRTARVEGDTLTVRGTIEVHPNAAVEGEQTKLSADDFAERIVGIGKEQEPAAEPVEALTPAGKTKRKGNLVKFGDEKTVVPADEIRIGDVGAFGGPVEIDGEVRGEVVSFGGPITVRGEVTGDVGSFGGPVTLKDGSHVHGDIVTFGGKTETEPGARVDGDIGGFGGGFKGLAPGGRTAALMQVALGATHWLTSTVLVLIVALVVVLLAPNATQVVADAITQQPGVALAHGLLAVLLFLPVCITLILTLVGVLAIPLLILFVLIAATLGTVGVYLILGRKIAQRLNWSIASIVGLAVLGALMICLVNALDVVAVLWPVTFLVACAVFIFGLGGALMTGLGTHPRGTFVTHRLTQRNHTDQPQAASADQPDQHE